MKTYEYLQKKNKDKLKRINCPAEPVNIKGLVFDEYHPYENSITKFKKTDLYKENEKLGIHGLHVGTVAQQLNKKIDLYGLSFTPNFEKVVDYCIKENIRIVNTSFSCIYSKERNRALKRYADWGGIWVSASGNEDDNKVDFPASSEYTIGVSATNSEDSNGEEVNTTADSYWAVSDQFDRPRNFNGTSCATPVIFAVASYYLYHNPNGDLESFSNWLDINEVEDLDKVLDYDKSFGNLEEDEEFFVFPNNLIDEELKNQTVIKLYPEWSQSQGSYKYLMNDNEEFMDVKPKIENGRTFVPIRFVAEALGCEVEWNEEKGEVKIIK